jgi:hypothetical protein
MRLSAVACDVYQTTDVAYPNDWELQIMSIRTRLLAWKTARRGPSTGHISDNTEHKGYGRKGDRR